MTESLLSAARYPCQCSHDHTLSAPQELAAAAEEVFCNASVGFDLDTMQPAFRVIMGVPGVSSGLAVAQRFSLPAPVVDAARLLPKEYPLQQHLLQRISQELDKTAANRDASDALLQKHNATPRGGGRTPTGAARRSSALEKMRAELTQEVKQARADCCAPKRCWRCKPETAIKKRKRRSIKPPYQYRRRRSDARVACADAEESPPLYPKPSPLA